MTSADHVIASSICTNNAAAQNVDKNRCSKTTVHTDDDLTMMSDYKKDTSSSPKHHLIKNSFILQHFQVIKYYNSPREDSE